MNDHSNRPRLRRADVPEYLREKFGIDLSPKTLAKYASVGGGPAMRYNGRFPLYDVDELDRWASERLGKPVRSTSERACQ